MAKLPRNTPIPDDPTSLSKDQMDAMLSVARHRCATPGQRVRIHSQSERLNGLLGTVKSATEGAAWIMLDPVDPDDLHPEEIRFWPGDWEVIDNVNEAQEQDMDAPEPYAAALDYITPLKSLGFRLLAGEWRKDFLGVRGYQWEGNLQVRVVPLAAAANVSITYRDQSGEADTLFRAATPAIDVLELVREIELCTEKAGNLSDFSAQLQKLNWPKSQVMSPDRVQQFFGEAIDPDAPEHYINELQAHARIINAFRASDYSARIARKPQGERKYYEMFVVRHPASDNSYELFLEPLQDGSWAVSARGYKYFEHERHGEIQEMFEIPSTWEIPAGISDAELQPLIDHILADIHKHQGPEDLSDTTLDELDRLGESVDDINFDAYAKDSAGYNLVQLLTPKEVRAMIRAAGYKVNTLYRSKRTTGWSATATPATDEVFRAFRDDYEREKYRAETIIWKAFKERFPMYNESQLLDRVYFNVWNWTGATSADPENPNNYVLYVEIQPPDYQQRRRGVVAVKEAADPDDPEAFINNTRRAKMGDLVTIKCPGCGDVHQAFKNWPDELETDFSVLRLGTKCDKCETFIPYTNNFVGEAFEEPDPDLDSLDPEHYAKTTFEPRQFLEASGWTLQMERADYEYWRKEFPLPRNYVLGGMTFDQLVAQIGYGTVAMKFSSLDVNIFFNNREHKFGLPVKGWRLEPQMLAKPDDVNFNDTKFYDATMTLRRFAMGIGQVLANVPWPQGSGALAASSAVERSMAAFAHELNDRAEKPLNPGQVQEAIDPDAPDNYISSLGTVAHVAARFGMRLEGRTKWVREVKLNHPMELMLAGPRQRLITVFRVILDWNPEEGNAGWAELILRGRTDEETQSYLIWHASAAYATQAAAAWHLNQAMTYLFQSIDDTHEPHQYQQLKEILQMGVGPFMLRAADEDEDPI